MATTQKFTASELQAYLDEALPASTMAAVEDALRQQPELLQQLATLNGRRDAGMHSLGEIWRRHRLSCPTRDELGSYVLGVISDDAANYLKFHLEVVGCRLCQASLEDLKNQEAEATNKADTRRRKYFQSSAGYLRKE